MVIRSQFVPVADIGDAGIQMDESKKKPIDIMGTKII